MARRYHQRTTVSTVWVPCFAVQSHLIYLTPVYPEPHLSNTLLWTPITKLYTILRDLSKTWFIQHLVNPTPGLSNTWFIQHLVNPTPGLSNTWFIQHLVNPTPESHTWLIWHVHGEQMSADKPEPTIMWIEKLYICKFFVGWDFCSFNLLDAMRENFKPAKI
jgi:hypothetical protein